jgi:hypothetical protein
MHSVTSRRFPVVDGTPTGPLGAWNDPGSVTDVYDMNADGSGVPSSFSRRRRCSATDSRHLRRRLALVLRGSPDRIAHPVALIDPRSLAIAPMSSSLTDAPVLIGARTVCASTLNQRKRDGRTIGGGAFLGDDSCAPDK